LDSARSSAPVQARSSGRLGSSSAVNWITKANHLEITKASHLETTKANHLESRLAQDLNRISASALARKLVYVYSNGGDEHDLDADAKEDADHLRQVLILEYDEAATQGVDPPRDGHVASAAVLFVAPAWIEPLARP